MEIAGERAVKLSSYGNNLFAIVEFDAVCFLDGSVRRIPFRTYPVGVQVFVEGLPSTSSQDACGSWGPGPAMNGGKVCIRGRHDERRC